MKTLLPHPKIYDVRTSPQWLQPKPSRSCLAAVPQGIHATLKNFSMVGEFCELLDWNAYLKGIQVQAGTESTLVGSGWDKQGWDTSES